MSSECNGCFYWKDGVCTHSRLAGDTPPSTMPCLLYESEEGELSAFTDRFVEIVKRVLPRESEREGRGT